MKHTIYQGNALEVLNKLPEKSVNCVMTIPPYADMKDYGHEEGTIKPDEYSKWFIPKVKGIYRILKDDGSFILNINDKVVDGFRHTYVFETVLNILKETKFKLYERLFWNKGKYLPNKSRFGDKVEYIFWFVKSRNFKLFLDNMRVPYDKKSIERMKNPIIKRFNRENTETKEYKDWSPNPKGALPSTLVSIGSESQNQGNHFAVFPEKLVKYFLLGTTDKGDLVCDPFSGSSTVNVVAEKLGRNSIGIEISEKYIEIAKKRMKKFVGQTNLKGQITTLKIIDTLK